MRACRTFLGVGITLLLAGCTFATPRYSISADNNEAVKFLGVGNIGIGGFSGASDFDSMFRLAGTLAPVDNVTYTDYIRKAFIDEFKLREYLARNSRA